MHLVLVFHQLNFILYVFMFLHFIVLSRFGGSSFANCMLASGSDDGTVSVRDIRLLKVCIALWQL
jgi:hypothetical protein